MAGAFGRGAPALVVNLRRGDVPVPEQVFHLDDVHAGVEEKRGRGRPERMRCVDAALNRRAVRVLLLFEGTGELFQVALNQQVRGRGLQRPISKA